MSNCRGKFGWLVVLVILLSLSLSLSACKKKEEAKVIPATPPPAATPVAPTATPPAPETAAVPTTPAEVAPPGMPASQPTPAATPAPPPAAPQPTVATPAAAPAPAATPAVKEKKAKITPPEQEAYTPTKPAAAPPVKAAKRGRATPASPPPLPSMYERSTPVSGSQTIAEGETYSSAATTSILPLAKTPAIESRLQVAQVIHIMGQPVAERSAASVPLKIGSPIYKGDIIATVERTRATIKFNDQSLLNIGSNTRIQINQYVYNEKDKIRDVNLKLMGGHLRMLARKLSGFKKTDVKLDTPTATIGVRGTEFIVSATKVKKFGKMTPKAQLSSDNLWALNDYSEVASDAAPGNWVAQGTSGDDTQWLVYVYCLDGSIYVQNLFGGPVYMIPPGQTGWVQATGVTSVQDIPPEQVQSMFLMTAVPGSSYGDGRYEDNPPAPVISAPTAPPTIKTGQTPVVPIENIQLGPTPGVTPPPPPVQVLTTISTTVPGSTSMTTTSTPSTTPTTIEVTTTEPTTTEPTTTIPTTVSSTSISTTMSTTMPTTVSTTIPGGGGTSTVPSP